AETRESQQATIRDFVDAMAVSVIAAQGQPAKLLACAGLQAAVVATRAGAEFVNVAEAPIERLVVGEGREAAIADRLIAVQLHLIGFMDGARADIINA